MKNFKLRWIAEKACFVGCYHFKKLGELCAAAAIKAKKIVIVVVTLKVQFLNAVGKPVFYKVLPVFCNKYAALLVDKVAQLQKFFVRNLQVFAKGRCRAAGVCCLCWGTKGRCRGKRGAQGAWGGLR